MDKVAANREFVLSLLKAYADGDLRTIEKGLDLNFVNWRWSTGEVSRHQYLREIEILFAAREFSHIEPTHTVTDETSVAVELRMTTKLDGKTLEFLQHNLFLIEDGRLVGLRQYGDAPLS